MIAIAKAPLCHASLAATAGSCPAAPTGHLDGDGPLAKGGPRDQVGKAMPMLPLVLSSDSHVFEPPDLWQTRIDRAFRDRAPRIERIDGADHVVVEADQILSGIGLISNAGARFAAPETISAQGRFEDVHRGGYDPEQHLEDMALDGVAGEVLYPSQGLFYFKVVDPPLMSAIFRAYNDWLAEFCRTDPAPPQGHRDDQPGRRPGRDQGAGACRPPGPGRRDDHRVSARGLPRSCP